MAAHGPHTFSAVDNLAESRAASRDRPDPDDVLVLPSTELGKRSFTPDGQPFWATLVEAGFTSSDQAEVWCASTYPMLTPEELADAGAAGTLAPPHD